MVSFYEVVNLALMQEWKVELWTWKLALSKNYFNYLNSYSGTGNFKIFYLDEYRDIITYVHDPNAVALRERNERTGRRDRNDNDDEDHHNHDHHYRQKNVHSRDNINNNDNHRDSDYDSMDKRRRISPQSGGEQEHFSRSSNVSYHSDHHDYRDHRHDDNRTYSSSDHYYHHSHSHSESNNNNRNNNNRYQDRSSATTSGHHDHHPPDRYSPSAHPHPQRRDNEHWLPERQGQHTNYQHRQPAQSRRTPPPFHHHLIVHISHIKIIRTVIIIFPNNK
jgi:hypothetical protein